MHVCSDTANHSTAKPGQKTLSELDEFRYHEAIDLFASENPKRPMSLEDVKLLVDWKL